ncbi:Gfo/Idh/MocA family oxidoreductase [Microbacterium sp. LWH11-1.2]|uniref:Gfo/Idh/MocA family protein n=1 Tax=Microbacterium sp. LWH11-1.2 TaxID=3135258 RepID=UPI00313A050F
MNDRSSRPTRLGIIGTGIVAGLHLDAIAEAPGIDLVAVCDIDQRRAAEAAERFAARTWQDYREMFAAEQMDGVVITSPHSLHTAMAKAAAEAGVAVLVEKPMATTLADADEIIDTCERAGVPLSVGHVLRFDPAAEAAASVIESGRIGRPLAISHRRSAHYRPGSRPDWFFDPVVAGGGIAMNVGPHGIDRIQWFGGGLITEIGASTWKRGGLAVETDVMATARLESGVTATIVLTSADIPFVDETLVICERGSLRCSATEGTWISEDGAERLLLEPAGTAAAFSGQLADFVGSIRGENAPRVGGAYGRTVLSAVLAMYESAETGAPVALPARTAGVR